METYGLEKYGITGIKEIVYNPSFEEIGRASCRERVSFAV